MNLTNKPRWNQLFIGIVFNAENSKDMPSFIKPTTDRNFYLSKIISDHVNSKNIWSCLLNLHKHIFFFKPIK